MAEENNDLEEILLYKPRETLDGKSFDKDIFVPEMSKLNDLKEYRERIAKDRTDISAIADAGGRLFGKPNLFTNMDNPDLKATAYLNESIGEGTDVIAKYVKENSDDFFDKLGDNNLINLIYSVPVYETSDEDHNKFVRLLNKVKGIDEASKDPSARIKYVQDRISKAPDWFQTAYYYFSDREDNNLGIFKLFAEHAQLQLQKEFFGEDGKINTNKLEKRVKDSLDKAWDEYNKEPNEGSKKDIWERDIRPIYLALAELAYPGTEEDYKYDKDPDREDRKADRREVGMRN